MKKQFEKIHDLLNKEHTLLIEEIKGIDQVAARDFLSPTSAFGQKEEASAAFSEIERRSIESGTLRARLLEIEAALRKLDTGTYGLCDNCGDTIPLERLEAMPHTVYCVDCRIRIQKPHQNTTSIKANN